MDKEFVPYEQALALKELGFPQDFTNDGIWYYVTLSSGIINSFCWTSGEDEPPKMFKPIIRPTFSQAFRWFRDRHQLSGTSQYFKGGYYCYTINDMKDTQESNRLFTEFENYEEAELTCLKKLIEIVKQNQ